MRLRLASICRSAATCVVAIAVAGGTIHFAKAEPPAGSRKKPMPPTSAQPSLEKTAAGSDAFARALYARLSGEEGNLAVSPASVESCILLAWAGARGQTAAEIATALRLTEEQTRDAAALLEHARARLTPPPGDPVVRSNQPAQPAPGDAVIANSVWVQKSFPVHAEYRKLLEDSAEAGFETVDFIDNTEAARAEINTWVDDQTKHKIAQLLPKGSLDNSARLVLVNAIYFKAGWLRPFSKDWTKDQPFHRPGQADVTAPLMNMDARFRYLETEAYQALEIPYAKSQYTMVVWLPRHADALDQLERALTDGGTAELSKLASAPVNLFLPKFRATSSLSLADTLAEMGMKQAFTPQADFSGISEERLAISKVVHQALVEVDEKGTEAAAATGAVAVATAARPEPEQKKIFRADHPFVFAIRNRDTGDLLFMGRVANPAQ